MTSTSLHALKRALQGGTPKELELLAAALVGRLVGTRFSVARGGFQHGADAGTVGRAGRNLRLECKRYADDTPLDDRNLQGEVDDSLRQDPALEAWILCATRDIPQQTEEKLREKATASGVPILFIDWPDGGADLAPLAALCAWAPDIVEQRYGKDAARNAKRLSKKAQPVVERLSLELSPWVIGYDALVARTRARQEKLWTDSAESRSAFGQNVAVGAVPFVERKQVNDGLTAWWQSPSEGCVVVHGDEGMGKTWAAFQWIWGNLAALPAVLLLPSSAFKAMRGTTRASVVEFLGDALHELSPSTERRFWSGRIERLLQRPITEGPALLVVVDGANQEPSFDWLRLLQVLDGEDFRHRIRVIFTTQSHFLSERLNGLKSLGKNLRKVAVGPYDISHGGEFDTLLAKHGLSRSSLATDIIPLARVPRLFELTIRLKAEADMQGEPTRSRLLWAHARDELGLKARAALTESDWNEWLRTVAARYQADISDGAGTVGGEGFTATQLGEMVRDPSGSPDETSRRLDEIVSGNWLEQVPGSPGRMRPRQATIQLALGVAVLAALERAEAQGPQRAAQVLEEYLDAVRAISEAAEILASALSILVDRRWPADSVVPQLVLSALLNSQNASDAHRQYAIALAPALVGPLLFVAETSDNRAGASARHWALQALHGIVESNSSAWNEISERLVAWVAHAVCPAPTDVEKRDDSAKHHEKVLMESVGVATAGTHTVMGVPIRLHERERDDLGVYVPQLLLGKPLVPSIKVVVAAAVASAIGWGGKTWQGLWWLVLLNNRDRGAVKDLLTGLSVAASTLDLEAGVAASFAERVSSKFLWLSGDEELERRAAAASSAMSGAHTYEKHYLSNPAQSIFPLERRHLDLVLNAELTPPLHKLRRLQGHLEDPTLQFSAELSDAVIEWGRSLKLENLHSHGQYSTEEHNYDEYLPWAARIAAASVADVVSRWFDTFWSRAEERRRWASLHVPHVMLLTGPKEVDAMRAMRSQRPAAGGDQEAFILLCLLQGELLHAPVDVQLDALVQEKDAFISIALVEILRPPAPDTVASFVNRWGLENERAVEVLCNYLYNYPAHLGDSLFENLVQLALDNKAHQPLLFLALEACEPVRLGQRLWDAGWVAVRGANELMQEAGSRALFAARPAEPLSALDPAVAPWCLLEEALKRGASKGDMSLAAAAIDRALHWDGFSALPVVATISVEATGRRSFVHINESARAGSEDDFFKGFDPKARWERAQAARKSGESFLEEAKTAGAVMATRVIGLDAARALIEQCPDVVAAWLEGLDVPKPALLSRVNLAGGLFTALCEELLRLDPERGAALWHVLRDHLRISFTGVGGLDQLLLMLFRAPENAAVLKLRRHVYSLAQNPSDDSYLHIALAAISQGATSWLLTSIEEDSQSPEPFRMKRAIVLRGFLPPEHGTRAHWPEGETIGTWEALRRRAQVTRNSAVHSRYWFREFLSASDVLAAFCSWQLFIRCVDAMAWTWMTEEVDACRDSSELWRLKMLHMTLNESELKSAIKKRSSKGSAALDDKLVGQEKPEAWFSVESLSQLTY